MTNHPLKKSYQKTMKPKKTKEKKGNMFFLSKQSAASLIQRTWRDFALRMGEIRRMEVIRTSLNHVNSIKTVFFGQQGRPILRCLLSHIDLEELRKNLESGNFPLRYFLGCWELESKIQLKKSRIQDVESRIQNFL